VVNFGLHYRYHIDVDGQLIWKYDTGTKIYGPVSVDTDGSLYVGNYANCLYALYSEKKAAGQQLKWKTCAKGQGAMNSGPAFADNSTTLVMNDFDSKVRGFDMATGAIKVLMHFRDFDLLFASAPLPAKPDCICH
jgi:hypothetical protein